MKKAIVLAMALCIVFVMCFILSCTFRNGVAATIFSALCMASFAIFLVGYNKELKR